MPDTLNYMIGGYAFAFFLLAMTVGSLWLRYRSLVADEAALEKLEREASVPPSKAQPDFKGAPQTR